MKPRHLLPISALALVFVAPTAFGQSRMAQAFIGATNELNPLMALAWQDSTGAPVSASYSGSFTGLGGDGQQRTMTYQGTASAESSFGRLRASVQGSLTNTYYNEENPWFYTPDGANEEGSPSDFGVLAFTGFTDTLQFGGQLQSGYKAKYVFFVHGSIEGSRVNSYLYAQLGTNPRETFDVTRTPGPVGQYFTTQSVPINGQMQQFIDVDFTTQFLPSTRILADGSSISGTGAFSSTVTLTEVQLFDQNDNRVTDFTVTGSQGTVYPTQAVPEPASLAALAMGGLAFFARRRRR